MVRIVDDLSGAIFGSIDDVLFFDTPDLARPGADDEQFEQWLAGVSVSDFERLLNELLADSSGSFDSLSAP